MFTRLGNANCSPSENTQRYDSYSTIGNGEHLTLFYFNSALYYKFPVKTCHVDEYGCTKGITSPNWYHKDGFKVDCIRYRLLLV